MRINFKTSKMKNIPLYALMIVLLSSCKKSAVELYSGPANIYFTTATNPIPNWGADSLAVSFFLTNNIQDSLVKIPVRITGKIVNADRTYTLKVTEASTAKEGLNYDFYRKDFKIPAGKLDDSIRIILHRSADLKTKAVLLAFQLVSDQNFVTNIQDVAQSSGLAVPVTRFRLFASNILQVPASWYAPYLGTFSEKKFYLLLQLLNVSPAKFIGPIFSNVTPGELQNYGIAMQRYLNGQKAAGKTVYEDNGDEMLMGVSAQL